MIAQYILYQVYENGRIPDLSTSAGNRITIDGREIHVGQNINIPAIYRDIAKEFFFDTEIAERITKGLAMNDDIYNASTREAYYNDTLLPLIKNQDDFVGYLQSQIENDGHKKILSLLEKNYPDAIK